MTAYALFKAGFPTCHERCARNYLMVIFDVGPDYEICLKLGLS